MYHVDYFDELKYLIETVNKYHVTIVSITKSKYSYELVYTGKKLPDSNPDNPYIEAFDL
jgi:hypothetical protein